MVAVAALQRACSWLDVASALEPLEGPEACGMR